MSLTSSTRTVLIMSDEGLQIYSVGRMSTRDIEFITWDTEGFKETLKAILIKNCSKKPVIILNDMVEQHYRKERIPKVGMGDRMQVIKSRLNYVFPNNQIRAALKLKKNKNKSLESDAGAPYLFAAIPKSEAFNKTFNAVTEANVKLIGVYLLPVEGGALIEDLSKKLNKGNKVKSIWTIFVGQQSNGGLRQIVTRNGELALTRMTPIIDNDDEPEVWANEVSEELNSTMSYLTRFGYQKTDGLDIVIISNVSTQDALQNNIKIDADIRIMTVKDAAEMVSTRIGNPSNLRYTDLLYAAYLGKKSKFILPMQSKAIEGITRPRQIAFFILMGALLAAAYTGFLLFQSFSNNLVVEDSLSVTNQQIRTQEQEFKVQAARSKELGFDFLVVDGALENYYKLNKQKIDILYFMREVGRSLGADLTLDKIAIKKVPVATLQNGFNDSLGQDNASKQVLLESLLTLSFPNTIRPEQGVVLINALQQRLSQNLPDYTVKIIKQVADLSYTGNVVGGTNRAPAQNQAIEDFVAEIQITENQ